MPISSEDLVAENLANRAITIQLLAFPYRLPESRTAWVATLEVHALAYVQAESISLTQAEVVRAKAVEIVKRTLSSGQLAPYGS